MENCCDSKISPNLEGSIERVFVCQKCSQSFYSPWVSMTQKLLLFHLVILQQQILRAIAIILSISMVLYQTRILEISKTTRNPIIPLDDYNNGVLPDPSRFV